MRLGNNILRSIQHFGSSKKQNKKFRQQSARLMVESLEDRIVLTADPVISEFMAINDSTLQDQDGAFSDWIEIHNPTAATIDLEGWYLTDNQADMTKWEFPSVEIEAGGYLVVFASSKDPSLTSELHTNFKLSGSGEYLALVKPDGTTTTTEFAPFPQQFGDVAYGLGSEEVVTTLLNATDNVQVHIPDGTTGPLLGLDWTQETYTLGTNGESWTSPAPGGVGFDADSSDYDALIGTDVELAMHNVNPGAYIRSDFNVSDLSDIDSLDLNVQYDDGFVAYLNGEEIASRNAIDQGQSPSSGLISYWDFEGDTLDKASDYENNSGVAEDDLTGRGGIARFEAGQNGQALAIGMQVGDTTDLLGQLTADVQLPATYTIESWIKPSELSDSWQRLVLNWGGSNGGEFAYHFAIRNNGGFNNGVSLFHGQSSTAQVNTNGGTVALNQWQHIAGVADGNDIIVYLNGAEVARTPYDGTIFTSLAEGLGIADSAVSISTIKYNGLIDDLAIWNVPLTQQQIESHYLAGATGYGLTLNGSSTELDWSSPAATDRPDAQALQVETIDLSEFTEFLQTGNNTLAIHGLNSSAADNDFLIAASLDAVAVTINTSTPKYFTEATPGQPNRVGQADLGPIISNVSHQTLPPEGITVTPLLSAGDGVDVFTPTNDTLEGIWNDPNYVLGTNGESWTSGTSGVGFDLGSTSGFDPSINTNIQTAMLGNNASTYIRSQFNVTDPAAFDELKLRLQYDDGFVAFLNGQEILSRNAPSGSLPGSSGLVNFYDFDNDLEDTASDYLETASTAEDDLTPFLGTARYVTGNRGQAIALNQQVGDPVRLEAIASADSILGSAYSIEAWIHPTALNTWSRLYLNWGAGLGQSFHFALQNNNQVSLFHEQSNGAQPNTQGGAVALNQWQHIAGVADGSFLRVYLNGVQVASTPYDGTINKINSAIGIGDFVNSNSGATFQFQGYLDDLAVWNTALDATAIAAHFNAGSAGYGLTLPSGEDLAYNSSATAQRDNLDAVSFEEFDISAHLDLLQPGTNVLAIQGLNFNQNDIDFLITPELVAQSGSDTGESLAVTANVIPSNNPIQEVTLHYRGMFDAEQTLPMFDDGLHNDGVAGDGVFGATIPSSVADPGELVRYYITSTDTIATQSRAPLFDDPNGSAEYFGTVIDDPSIDTELPVLHRFIAPQNIAAADTRSGTRGSVFYNGEYYDNVFIRMRGQTSAAWPKKSYKIDFNDGEHFRFQADQPRVDEININTTYTDKSYIRTILAFESFIDAGVAASISFPLRMEQNGEFFSVAHFVEQPDNDFLRRQDLLDDDGILYKVRANGLGSVTSAGLDKKTPKDNDHTDVLALLTGLILVDGSVAQENFLFDNVNLAAQINYMAVNVIIQNIDRTVKNYYLYQDTTGSGEWWMLPWDVDLSFGPDALNTDVVKANFDDGPDHSSHPFFGGNEFPFRGLQNQLLDAVFQNDRTREMFLRRLRTLMDEQLQDSSTAQQDLLFEQRIDELVAQLQPDVDLDRAKWGANAHFGGTDPTLLDETNELKDQYFALRRTHLFESHSIDNVNPPSLTTLLSFGAAATAFVPADDSLGTNWTNVVFDDSTWISGTSGVGYDEAPDYIPSIGVNLRTGNGDLSKSNDPLETGTSINDSAYIRIPFQVTDANAMTQLKLKMKYDDGFVAYLNGVEVASAFAPGRNGDLGTLTWNSAATANHADGLALSFVQFDISSFGGPGGVLVNGTNVLAIHSLNDITNGAGTSSDALILPELINGIVSTSDSVGIPHVQDVNVTLTFGAVETSPASGNQDEEYIEIVNNNLTAVDLSGWKVTGGVEHEFQPGTVILPGETLYITPNALAFRARSGLISGGEGLHIQGNYKGHLSNSGELLELINSANTVVASITTPINLTENQEFLRITEVHYHPSGTTDTEFIEFYNTSSTETLDLAGVQITEGPLTPFVIPGSTSLLPGAYLLVVQDTAAFTTVYPGVSAALIIGEYDGSLSNGGEKIKVEDALNNTILDFKYEDGTGIGEELWHPETDGGGFSLVVLNTEGDYEDPTNWRSSALLDGSPGTEDAAVDDLTYLSADFNGDGTVDTVDMQILLSNYGTSTDANRLIGDANNDRRVSLHDLLLLKKQFNSSIPSAPQPAAAAAALTVSIGESSNQTRLIENRILPIRHSSAIDHAIFDMIRPASSENREEQPQEISIRRARSERHTNVLDQVFAGNLTPTSSRIRSNSRLRSHRGHKLEPILLEGENL